MIEAKPKTRTITMSDLQGREGYKLLTSIVIPRPIAWVSTLSPEGIPNLAPYSFFNAVAGAPPTVMFSAGRRASGEPKDSLKNAQATGEFVVNLVDEALAEAMNETSADWEHGISEFDTAGLSAAPSNLVTPPRVANAPVALEAKVTQIISVEGSTSTMVLGRVLQVHVSEALFADDGLVHAERLRPVARMGRNEYTTLGKILKLERPTR